MTNSQVKTIIFSTGERFPFLIDISTGKPDSWATIYTTTQLRAKGYATGTIEQVLRNILIFKYILQKHNIGYIELIARFKEGIIFHLFEIEGLIGDCKFYLEDLENESTSNWPQKISFNSLEKFRKIETTNAAKMVSPETAANRIISIRDYMSWFIDVQMSKIDVSNLSLQKLINSKKDFIEKVNSRIPKKSNGYLGTEKIGLSKEHLEILLSITSHNSSNNPWHSKFTKLRNELLILWLFRFGLRRSELLNIKVSDIDFREETFLVLRRADDPDDPRSSEPNVKTKGRKIAIPPNLIDLTRDYILKYRSKLPYAKKHEFLMVSDKTGKPLSKIAVNKIFEQLRNKNSNLPKDFSPHIARHTWNDQFSKLMDKNNVSEEKEQKMRSYLMGWSENSTSAATYTKRHTREKANKAIVDMADKIFLNTKEDIL